MSKINLVTSDKIYYNAKPEPRVVELENHNYLTIQGISSPENELFNTSIEALYAVAFKVKMKYKDLGSDFVMPKLEAFWWVEPERPFDEVPREDWHWKLIIRMPDFVNIETVAEGAKIAFDKKGSSLIKNVKFEEIREGKSIQALHIGSYDAEAPTIKKILDHMEKLNFEMGGYHHEIYLSDPRKTAEEKLKTIIRYAVKEKEIMAMV